MTPSHGTNILPSIDPSPRSEQHSADRGVAWRTSLSTIRWMETCAAFADSGGMASGDELAHRLSAGGTKAAEEPHIQGIALVARWIAAQSVVSVLGPRGWMLPMFQFDVPTATLKPSMAPLLAVLHGVFDEAELALWFVAPNNWLDGGRPAIVMCTNLPAALTAAYADRCVACGH
jgi:hypothetical protein